MKASLKLFITVLILFTSFKYSNSQIPTYTLTAKNFELIAPNAITFDMILVHTDANQFEYGGGQYFFNFNNSIANGGTLSYAFAQTGSSLDSSSFTPNMRPRNPQISGTQLRLAANSLPGAGNGTIIPEGVQWKVCKMRLATTAPTFAVVNFDLQWRNAPTANPVTKLNAYIGTTNTEITTTNTHTVDFTFISPLSISIKILIEGLYNQSTDQLRKSDSITVYLRSVNSPYSILDSAKSKIDSLTFNASLNFLNSLNGTYYLQVKHKNSLETWSKAGGTPFVGSNTYDFTSSASQAYGNNMVLRGTKYCIYSGNVNGDNIIDLTDMYLVDNAAFNYTGGSSIYNLNGDNIVDIEDLAIADRNGRNFRSVQKPAVLASSGKKKMVQVFNKEKGNK